MSLAVFCVAGAFFFGGLFTMIFLQAPLLGLLEVCLGALAAYLGWLAKQRERRERRMRAFDRMAREDRESTDDDF